MPHHYNSCSIAFLFFVLFVWKSTALIQFTGVRYTMGSRLYMSPHLTGKQICWDDKKRAGKDASGVNTEGKERTHTHIFIYIEREKEIHTRTHLRRTDSTSRVITLTGTCPYVRVWPRVGKIVHRIWQAQNSHEKNLPFWALFIYIFKNASTCVRFLLSTVVTLGVWLPSRNTAWEENSTNFKSWTPLSLWSYQRHTTIHRNTLFSSYAPFLKMTQ